VDRSLIAIGLIAHQEQVLLVRESYGLQLWGLPGGRIEPGEPIVEAALREVYEETGLHAQVEGLLCVRERDNQICLILNLSASSSTPATRDPDEIIDMCWIDRKGLASGQYDVDDLSRHVLCRWFEGQVRPLPVHRWTGRDGREANLFL
jgi:8-oxo-dGTP pyrophosphatase MutT (NUDIX family)